MRPFAVFLLFVAARGAPAADPPRPQVAVPEGLIAIGDVHGDIDTFRQLLRSLEVIDERDRWTGGSRRLVQVGDLLDRAPGSRQVLDLMIRLESQAAQAGGAVIQLLGNHEIMNMVGDLASTTVEEFVAYQDIEDADERATRRARILKLLREGSSLLRSGYAQQFYKVLNERTFDRWFPPGFFGHRAALAPAGRYGKWLLAHPVMHKEADTLFLHAGLHFKYASFSPEQINSAVRQGVPAFCAAVAELEKLGVYDAALGLKELAILIRMERAAGMHAELRAPVEKILQHWDSLLFDEDGPLWYRGLADRANEARLARDLDATLAAQGVARMVIGHTQPPSLRVELLFGSKVVLIDTGMNQLVYRGKPSALVLTPVGELKVWE